MVEIKGGIKIGAVYSNSILLDRVRISRLKKLSPQEAKDNGYQTMLPALVPTQPRGATLEELSPFITEDPNSREHVLYLRLGEQAIKKIREQTSEHIAWHEGPIIELVEGVPAHFSRIRRADPNLLTTSRMSSKINPHLAEDPRYPSGSIVSFHFDSEDELPVRSRLEDSRRLVVNMGEDSRFSLIVVPEGVLDTARELYPNNPEYIPRGGELLPRLGKKIQEDNSNIRVFGLC